MTCKECEIGLGMGEDVGEHLACCAECRGLARELRLNLGAMREMRRRPVIGWAWAFAVVVVGISWVVEKGDRPLRPLPVQKAATYDPTPGRSGQSPFSAHSPSKRTEVRLLAKARATKTKKVEPLRVKMFTADPDVVIYWIVDKKDGFE